MNKEEFLMQLRRGLKGLPKDDIEERLMFYGEMIDDRTEEGKSEENAIDEIGTADSIISQIISDYPLSKLVKERIKPKKRLRVWEIVLLILGSPVWLPLMIALFAVIISFYVVFWSLIIALWAVFVSVAGCGLSGIAAGVLFAVNGKVLTGIAVIGAAVICLGLSVFLFYGCKAATKGISVLTKIIAKRIKNRFIEREEKQ